MRCLCTRCATSSEVFTRTWGQASWPADGSAPVDAPFWTEATAQVKRGQLGFLFMAEVYWDLEWELQQQGFDYTYDKRLYDHLREQDAAHVVGHLGAEAEYQRRSMRFLENHDEPRAASVFPLDMHRIVAVLTFLGPGLRFFHQGQLKGWLKKIPMQLCRAPEQPTQPQIEMFYERLLELLRHAVPGRQLDVEALDPRAAAQLGGRHAQDILEQLVQVGRLAQLAAGV